MSSIRQATQIKRLQEEMKEVLERLAKLERKPGRPKKKVAKRKVAKKKAKKKVEDATK